MITDEDFWIEIRQQRSSSGDLFKSMLVAIHARQVALDSRDTSMDREEYSIASEGKTRRTIAECTVLTGEQESRVRMEREAAEERIRKAEEPIEENKAFYGGAMQRNDPRRVASISIRVLQQIMLFAVPIYTLRYNIPAMSMSWNTSCFIDRPSRKLITFGAGHGVRVPQQLYGRGCVAGDGFFALLTDNDEVWSSGGLKVSGSGSNGPTTLGRDDAMTGIAGKTLMLVGHGPRLAIVTRAFTVRPLSAMSNPTRSVMPSRHVRFVDLGYGDDYYMVGTDSIVYKTTASKRSVSTPRRVMTLSRTAASRVASGTSFLLTIDQNGHLYTFGRNKKGQLGNGYAQDTHRTPYLQDTLRHHFFVQVAAGDSHSLALTSNGRVYGAGSNENGQLGLGSKQKQFNYFTEIRLPARCTGIAAGPMGSMFALDNGSVYTCGLNDSMQLGLDTSDSVVYEPMPISLLQNGVESYTMDFGGFRPPSQVGDGDGGSAPSPSPEAPAHDDTGLSGPAVGEDRASGRDSNNVTVIVSRLQTPRGGTGEHEPVGGSGEPARHNASSGTRPSGGAARPTAGQSGGATTGDGTDAGTKPPKPEKQKEKCGGCCSVM